MPRMRDDYKAKVVTTITLIAWMVLVMTPVRGMDVMACLVNEVVGEMKGVQQNYMKRMRR
jgi:hypothetical protein